MQWHISISKRGIRPELTNWKCSQLKSQSCHSSSIIYHPHSQTTTSYNTQTMAPLLKSLYRPSQRSLLSSLFTATFLGAVVVVAFPCPIRPTNISGRAEARLDSQTEADTNTNTGRRNGEVVVLMNQRGRRFLEERWDRWVDFGGQVIGAYQSGFFIGAHQPHQHSSMGRSRGQRNDITNLRFVSLRFQCLSNEKNW